MAPIGQVLGHELFSKTKMCRYYRVGKCAKGMQCPWAHDASELKAAPDLRCTKLCKELITKGKCTKVNCNFAHSKAECRTLVQDADWEATVSGTLNSVPVAKNSTIKNLHVGQAFALDVPKSAPVNFNADAPEFVPEKLGSEVPAFVTMLSPSAEVRVDAPGFITNTVPAFVPMPSPPPGFPAPPPGLEDYASYSSSFGYTSSESDGCSSHEDIKSEDIKLDGNTPIADILAMFSLPKQTSPTPSKISAAKKKLAAVSTAGSLVDLLEEQRCVRL
eukprot:TRINITY_DN10855_c0_g1_i1.p1 TRINITY_DN10855_c0_g1~~TRINITY_DN10855_c0_g1_i1.p1  ORF type:complete len:275 (+),score=54.05 TRINITY_DN10855_c0_g1_i1:80-904(+)